MLSDFYHRALSGKVKYVSPATDCYDHDYEMFSNSFHFNEYSSIYNILATETLLYQNKKSLAAEMVGSTDCV